MDIMTSTCPQDRYNEAVRRVEMPARIKRLPVSDRGFPVPWFVSWQDGKPDFRVADRYKVTLAHTRKLCWVCGEPMGRFKAVTIGPMCAISRTISEPPSHRDCAVFSAQACPFLANPRTKRREDGLPDDRIVPPGVALSRNPGAIGVWITERIEPFRAGDGGTLFSFGDPVEVLWFAQGRAASRAEVEASIESGLPMLQALAEPGGAQARADLRTLTAEAMQYLPAEPASGA